MEEILITIPLKPANGKGKRAEKFRAEAEKYIPDLKPIPSDHKKRYSLDAKFFYVGECNGDMDNRLLCVFDALKQRVIYDDFQIKELKCRMIEYSKFTKIELRLKEIPAPKPDTIDI